jgi:hypothetical protein
VKLFWLIVAGVCIVVAAYFLWRRDFDTAFVIAALGAVAWFLNYRAQLKEITTAADALENDEEINDDSEE